MAHKRKTPPTHPNACMSEPSGCVQGREPCWSASAEHSNSLNQPISMLPHTRTHTYIHTQAHVLRAGSYANPASLSAQFAGMSLRGQQVRRGVRRVRTLCNNQSSRRGEKRAGLRIMCACATGGEDLSISYYLSSRRVKLLEKAGVDLRHNDPMLSAPIAGRSLFEDSRRGRKCAVQCFLFGARV
eukprot:1147906-Pelagomonas_calceolata.AAC.1